MDNLDEVFKQIINEYSGTAERESALKILEAFITQIDSAQEAYNELQDDFNKLQNTYNLVLEALPTPIWVVNSDGSFFYCNSGAQKIQGILEAVPSDFSEFEAVFKGENYLLHKITKNDKIIITATNITNEKQRERLASMGQISAHLAHEIRNPIGAITLMISSLLNENLDLKTKLCILQMKKALWQVERLIKATLMISKGIQSTRQRHKSDIIQRCIEDLAGYFDCSKKIDFSYDLSAESIVCDSELLNILLQNLISNAIDSIEESENITRGEIKVCFAIENDGESSESSKSAKSSKSQILRIYDNGEGAKEVANLFTAFKSTKAKGNGLGLALCKQIAEAHNGAIFYQKTPKCFVVNLGEI